jgi:ABC-type glycerol-3-phosphate transport system permease component
VKDRTDWTAHLILGLGVLLFVFPVWLVFTASTQGT